MGHLVSALKFKLSHTAAFLKTEDHERVFLYLDEEVLIMYPFPSPDKNRKYKKDETK